MRNFLKFRILVGVRHNHPLLSPHTRLRGRTPLCISELCCSNLFAFSFHFPCKCVISNELRVFLMRDTLYHVLCRQVNVPLWECGCI